MRTTALGNVLSRSGRSGLTRILALNAVGSARDSPPCIHLRLPTGAKTRRFGGQTGCEITARRSEPVRAQFLAEPARHHRALPLPSLPSCFHLCTKVHSNSCGHAGIRCRWRAKGMLAGVRRMSGMELIFPFQDALLKGCTSFLKIFSLAATRGLLADEHSPAFHRLAPLQASHAGSETSHRDPVAHVALPQRSPELPPP